MGGKVGRPRREEAMKEQKGVLKTLIKDDDETIMHAMYMNHHGRDINKRTSANDMSDEEFEAEVDGYLMYCYNNKQVPTQTGLCLWLGVSRDTMNRWRQSSSESKSRVAKNAIEIFHKIIEEKALDGELNPVLYMFYGKNWFGLSDKTEIVHKSQTTQVIDISEQQRILRSTPGVVVDAEFTEKDEDLEERRLEDLEIPNNPEDLGSEDLGELLRGSARSCEVLKTSENLDACRLGDLGTHTPEDLGTFAHTDTQTSAYTDARWNDDDL